MKQLQAVNGLLIFVEMDARSPDFGSIVADCTYDHNRPRHVAVTIAETIAHRSNLYPDLVKALQLIDQHGFDDDTETADLRTYMKEMKRFARESLMLARELVRS